MSTKEWGSPMWLSMHHVAMGYSCNPTPHEINSMYNYLYSIPGILPCKECKSHASQYIQQHHPNLRNSCTVQAWVFDFHNSVNNRLGKPIFTKAQYQRKYGRAVQIHKDNRKREQLQ